MKALIRYKREQSCILLSTHEIKEAEEFLDRAIYLRKGEVIGDILSDNNFIIEHGGFSDYFRKIHQSGEVE